MGKWICLLLLPGEFGVVYKSHLLQVRDGDDITIVAVKTLKGKMLWFCEYVNLSILIGCFDANDVEQLVKESLRMKDFQHHNVMGLLGVCLDAGPAPYLVLPYMANGDLLSHLKANRETLVLSDEVQDDEVLIQIHIKIFIFLL